MKIARSHRTSIFHYAIIIMGVALLLEGSVPRCAAYVMREVWSGNDPIPRENYKSWSLFLISSPEWLLRQSDDKLHQLYENFRVFGNAIGSDNVAMWFWSRKIITASDDFREVVDVPRSIAFCKLST